MGMFRQESEIAAALYINIMYCVKIRWGRWRATVEHRYVKIPSGLFF